MLFRSSTDGRELVVECDARLRESAEALFSQLRALSNGGYPLNAGSTVRYGWSILTLRAETDSLRVCEPAFDQDPFNEMCPTLDNTLKVFEEQAQLVGRAGVGEVSVLFSDEAFVRNKALEASDLFLKRQQPAGPEDSGWYIGNMDSIEVDDSENSSEVVRIFELLRRRPAILQALTLPPEYLVVLRGDTVSEILDKDGINHWQ
jgi:hypothetical protein